MTNRLLGFALLSLMSVSSFAMPLSKVEQTKTYSITIDSKVPGQIIPFSGTMMSVTETGSMIRELHDEMTPFTFQANASFVSAMLHASTSRPELTVNFAEVTNAGIIMVLNAVGHSVVASYESNGNNYTYTK